MILKLKIIKMWLDFFIEPLQLNISPMLYKFSCYVFCYRVTTVWLTFAC